MQRRSYQYQDEPNRVKRFICNVLDTEDTEHVARHLPQCSHCYDPTVAFAVYDGLNNVRGESEAEENGEEICGSRIWTKVWPLGVWIRLSWAASHCG